MKNFNNILNIMLEGEMERIEGYLRICWEGRGGIKNINPKSSILNTILCNLGYIRVV